jgi:heme/copper-type cytochrome/quinol oxidase subunit 2
VSTITHVVLAVVLTLFLAAQARSFVFVMRCRRAEPSGRQRRRSDVLWTSIPLIIVLALAARSWVTIFDLQRAAAAAGVSVSATAPAPGASPR